MEEIVLYSFQEETVMEQTLDVQFHLFPLLLLSLPTPLSPHNAFYL